jgi:hypothetical protein
LKALRSSIVGVYRRFRRYAAPRISWLFNINSNHIIAIATVCAAFATGIYAVYARGQWKAMSDTLEQMKVSSQQTAIQTSDLLHEAQTMSDALVTSNDQNTKALEQTLIQSRAAIESSRKAQEIDQRAWISVEQMKITSQIQMGETLVLELSYKNSGKTPARSARLISEVRIEERLALPHVIKNPAAIAAAEFALGPGAQYTEHVRFRRSLTRTDVDYLASGIFKLSISGEITYRDVLEGTPIRKTGFCGIYIPIEFPLLSPCEGGSYVE